MNHSNLSLTQAPALATPLRFFFTAPVFLIIASLLLIFQGPDIIHNRWLPQTLALTHLITLGFISMTMMGALFQILPVLMGCNIFHTNRISFLVHILYTPGIVFLLLGFLYSSHIYHLLALFLLATSLIIFLGAVSVSLLQSRSTQTSSPGLSLAIVSFWIAITIALILLSSYALSGIPLLRQYTELHIGWAMAGWILMTIISVAYQVIPMFQITHEYPHLMKRYFIAALFLSLLLWSLLRIYEIQTEQMLHWPILLITSLAVFLLLLFVYFSLTLLLKRKKRMADTSLYFWMSSLLSLSISLLLYLYAEITQQDLSMAIGILFLAGFAMSVINGMLYKIIPFMIWLHLHRKLTAAGKRLSGIPTIYEIISFKKSRRLFVIHNMALITTLFALYIPEVFFYPASLLWLLNGVILMSHLLQALYTYHSFLNSHQ